MCRSQYYLVVVQKMYSKLDFVQFGILLIHTSWFMNIARGFFVVRAPSILVMSESINKL